ncbi:tRNA methyltransferase complex subunit Cpd1 [Paraphysoderma sedebokerense]|nr:tRNA methyltransferase complex subunit Cpd1 [Paraphysoderma sedebokerense]
MLPIIMKKGEFFNCTAGIFKHDDMIGLKWGSKLLSHNNQGYVFLLYPTPELWTLVLPHRTQILYIADISVITSFLNLRPGSIVLESGTGSGSFSHSLVRTIAPSGHLHTFEYHQERANRARKEFEDHGIAHLVTSTCRDVCRDGFGLQGAVDAVFLDLPAPWEAIPHAKKAFKQNQVGRICCFSPCIEQVQKTCAALNDEMFVDIKMYECLIRFHDVRTISVKSVKYARLQTRKMKSKNKQFKNEAAPEEDDIQANGENLNILQDGSGNIEEPLVKQMLVSKPAQDARGHTSYLTFATFIPKV